MLKAYEVMTHPLAMCAPDASVTDVAATMRDRDIGDVLIVEEQAPLLPRPGPVMESKLSQRHPLKV